MPFGFTKPTKEFSDEELLEKLEKADMNGPVSNFIMGELTRRAIVANRDSVNKLDQTIEKFSDSSDKYSRFLVLLTTILIVIAIIQLIVTLVQPSNIWWQALWLIVIAGLIAIILKPLKTQRNSKK